MFETLFKYQGVLARHRGGPFTDLRERFLVHCADQRMAHATLLRVANELLVVAGRMDLSAERQINLAEIEAAADEWSRYQQRRHRAHCQKWSRERFIQTAVPWLRFLGRFQEKEHQQRPYEHIVQDFASFMRNERGLSEVTIGGRCWQVNKFLGLVQQSGSFVRRSCFARCGTRFWLGTEKQDGAASLWLQAPTRCDLSSAMRKPEAGALRAWQPESKVQESSNRKLFP